MQPSKSNGIKKKKKQNVYFGLQSWKVCRHNTECKQTKMPPQLTACSVITCFALSCCARRQEDADGHPFNPTRVRLFKTKPPPPRWHHLGQEAVTKDSVQSSAITPQWPLIIFTGSLVVRMMDALMVVIQCSCSVD